jgi:hypothetical protein
VLALNNAPDGKVFIEVWPMKAEGGNLNIVKLLGSASGEARILRSGKAKFDAAVENDKDKAVAKARRARCISQGAHATSQG